VIKYTIDIAQSYKIVRVEIRKRTSAEEIEALRLELLDAPVRVLVVRVAAVDDDVALHQNIHISELEKESIRFRILEKEEPGFSGRVKRATRPIWIDDEEDKSENNMNTREGKRGDEEGEEEGGRRGGVEGAQIGVAPTAAEGPRRPQDIAGNGSTKKI